MAHNASQTPNRAITNRRYFNNAGTGGRRAVVESLFRQPTKPPPKDGKPLTFKVARSPLLDQLNSFLPKIESANTLLLNQPQEKLEEMDIENTDGCDKVVEMNIAVGEMDSDASDSEENSSEDSSSSDSEDNDSPMLGPVTEENIKIPTEAAGGKKGNKSLIEDLSKASLIPSESNSDDAEKSDSELTVASTGSGER
ncbi:unnamed protein product, partial [Meganyctiphanes norvegica]